MCLNWLDLLNAEKTLRLTERYVGGGVHPEFQVCYTPLPLSRGDVSAALLIVLFRMTKINVSLYRNTYATIRTGTWLHAVLRLVACSLQLPQQNYSATLFLNSVFRAVRTLVTHYIRVSTWWEQLTKVVVVSAIPSEFPFW